MLFGVNPFDGCAVETSGGAVKSILRLECSFKGSVTYVLRA